MNLIASIAVAFALIFGTATGTSEPPAQAVEVVQASPTTAEDEYQGILGMDATVTWDDYFPNTPMTGETVSYTWTGYAYEEPKNLPADEIALKSLDLEVWMTYKAMWLHHA